jgi:hypothetical protein
MASRPGRRDCRFERILDDSPYFGSNADGSNPTIDDVFTVFQAEFDVAYEEGGLYLADDASAHDRTPLARRLLERLIQYMKKKPGVWFATHEQIARHVKPIIAASASTSRAWLTSAARDSSRDTAAVTGAASRDRGLRALSPPP